MVSGLVTSPCDQLRIFSGEASEMRMASKSVMGLVSSNGLERYKTTLLGTWLRIDNSKACRCYDPGSDSARPVLSRCEDRPILKILGDESPFPSGAKAHSGCGR